MPLPPEVQKTLNAIDKKIRVLEDMKRRLIETFGEPVSIQPQHQANGNKAVAQSNRVEPPTVTLPSESPLMLSSSDRLFQFLRKYGPATRKEILEKSGVPDGSISYLLRNNPAKYRQREDQKWEVIA